MKMRAKDLRKRQTHAETKLWLYLKGCRFHGYKFRRQQVFESYIVDFVCLKRNLIIELDGSQHLENQEYDESRTKYLNALGFRVLRFWNNQVLQELPIVLHAIYLALCHPSPGASRHPLPQGERGNNYQF